MQQVHLRINDAATSKPTPVRLRITDADGNYYAPFGRLTEFATGVNQDVGGNVLIGSKKWAYIDGTCEILLPPGRLHIEITKGPEYTPIDEEITLLAGKLSLRFTIERWSDVRKQGWYSGDTRVHFLSPDAALLEGQAEDVAVVNVLIKESIVRDSIGRPIPAIPEILSFSGQSFGRQVDHCGVAINTLNRLVRFGSVGLLHCHRIVHPLVNEWGWSLADWCGQCHRKKGLVVWTEVAPRPYLQCDRLPNLVLGNIDAFEITDSVKSIGDGIAYYYRLLDAGLWAALVGASGKASNETVLGGMRTYALILNCPRPTFTDWIESVRAGNTYVTNGPLLNIAINADGLKPNRGAYCDPSGIDIHVDAMSGVPFGRMELLWNGEVIASECPLYSGVHRASIKHRLQPNKPGWFAIRCTGTSSQESSAFAHTSGFQVSTKGVSVAKPKSIEALISTLDEFLNYADARAPELCRGAEEARTVLLGKLS